MYCLEDTLNFIRLRSPKLHQDTCIVKYHLYQYLYTPLRFRCSCDTGSNWSRRCGDYCDIVSLRPADRMSISGYVSQPRFPRKFSGLGRSLPHMREPRHPLAIAFIELNLLSIEHEFLGHQLGRQCRKSAEEPPQLRKSIAYVATSAGFRDWKGSPGQS